MECILQVQIDNNDQSPGGSLIKVTFLCPNELQTEPLEGCPNATQQRNTLGQTLLHLCLSYKVSAEVTEVIYEAWNDAVFAKNELSKTPLDYCGENGGDEVIGDIIEAEGKE
eukprot:10821887-Ditylum_brightwellii.AAC.1